MKLFCSLALAAALMVPVMAAPPATPKSVVHVINVKFKADAAKAAVDEAINSIAKMNYPGLKNVWLKPIRMQGGDSGFTHCIVMEFESEDALKKYAGSDAQKEWYKKWIPVRELSNTHDITN